MFNKTLALSTAIAAALTAAPVGATTAISGNLNVVANSTIGAATSSQVDNQSWTTLPTALNASAVATLGMFGSDRLSTHGTAGATWASADSGTVTFTNYGWDFHVFSTPTSASDLTQLRGGSDWSYMFTATGNGLFTMNYNVLGVDNKFGLWGWTINCNCVGAGGPVINAFDPTTSGTFTGALVAGQTYTITLDGNPNISWPGPPNDYGGHMNGEFDWFITTTGPGVPEPATWTLMIGGLGLVGAAMRRRAAFSLA